MSLWRLVVSGRRYVVLADDAAGALSEARTRWPQVDFSKAVPVVHRDDNL